MTAGIGAVEHRSALASRKVLAAVLVLTLAGWIAVVAARGAILALETYGIRVIGEPRQNFATSQMVWAAGLVYLVCVLTSLITRRFWPSATLPVAYATGGAVVVTGAISTGMLGPLVVAVVMFSVIWLLGALLLQRMPATADLPLVRAPIAIGLGSGLLGLLLLLLATLGILNAATIIGGMAIILVFLLALDRGHLSRDVLRVSAWRPAAPSWFETIVTALAVGLVAFALLSCFVPENQSDAIRQHLPIAREIWQTGAAPEFPPMGASTGPIQSHLQFAVAYGFGGVTAAKLVHTLTGLAAVAGIAAIGWLCSGRAAAVVGAAIFATMPIVLWELGHAYLDLFPVLYTVAAMLCVLLWQHDGQPAWLVYAGALAGFGFATKIVMALMIVALGSAIFLVGRAPWRWRKRILAAVLFGVGVLVIVPWLGRAYSITGTLPGMGMLSNQIAGFFPATVAPADPAMATVAVPTVPVATVVATAPAAPPAAAGASVPTVEPTPSGPVTINTADSDTPVTAVGRAQFDFSRSPLDLIRVPWQVTFNGENYHSQGAGDVGIALLMLLPLAIFGPRTRAMAFLAVTAAVSYAAWWVTPQITRHLLPTLAIAAALAGIGVASVFAALTAKPPAPSRQILARVAQVGLVVALVAAPLLYLPNWKTKLPVDLFLGRETAAEYAARAIPSASVLAATSDMLPPDTKIGYIGLWEGPQSYTEARLTYWSAESFGSSTPAFRANLAEAGFADSSPEARQIMTSSVRDAVTATGIEYWVWNRAESRLTDWQSWFLDAAFLRDHAHILAGEGDTYLFEFLPDSGKTWGAVDLPNLLEDPDLETAGEDGPWTTTGKIKAKRGVVPIPPKSAIAQRVPATQGNAYLLVAEGSCASPADPAVLTLQWFDANDTLLGAVSESVIPGVEGSGQFIWRRAPEGTASVVAEVSASRGLGARCEFDEVSLYSPP